MSFDSLSRDFTQLAIENNTKYPYGRKSPSNRSIHTVNSLSYHSPVTSASTSYSSSISSSKSQKYQQQAKQQSKKKKYVLKQQQQQQQESDSTDEEDNISLLSYQELYKIRNEKRSTPNLVPQSRQRPTTDFRRMHSDISVQPNNKMRSSDEDLAKRRLKKVEMSQSTTGMDLLLQREKEKAKAKREKPSFDSSKVKINNGLLGKVPERGTLNISFQAEQQKKRKQEKRHPPYTNSIVNHQQYIAPMNPYQQQMMAPYPVFYDYRMLYQPIYHNQS